MVRLETVRAKVGATLLDVLKPGWADAIDPTQLSLDDCTTCVLGQLFGTFNAGAEVLFAMNRTDPSRENRGTGWLINRSDKGMLEAAARSGFYFDDSCDALSWDNLTDAWRREVRKRQSKATV